MRTPPPVSATTIFFVFFGVALLDAFGGGNLFSILFWLAVGAIFAYADVRRFRRVRAER